MVTKQQGDKDAVNLLELARNKNGLLQRYIDLSCEQSGSIQQDLMSGLEEILNQKDDIVRQVNQIDAQIRTLAAGLADEKNKSKMSALWNEWQHMRKNAEILLKKAKEVEDLNLSEMVGKRDRVVSELKILKETKICTALYRGNHVHIEGIFLDKKR